MEHSPTKNTTDYLSYIQYHENTLRNSFRQTGRSITWLLTNTTTNSVT